MIRAFITTLAFLFYFSASGQITISNKTKASPLDQSPLDMAYYPSDYTVLKSQDKIKDPPVARAIFSRPQKNKRVIFGELIEYGLIWRLGANEATELEFFKDVKLGGKSGSVTQLSCKYLISKGYGSYRCSTGRRVVSGHYHKSQE